MQSIVHLQVAECLLLARRDISRRCSISVAFGVKRTLSRIYEVHGLVIPAGLPDAQTLILVDKPGNGGVTTKEILPVRFFTT